MVDARVTWGAEIPSDAPVLGPNERCVELPLAFSVLKAHVPAGAWVLDAGCGMNRHVGDTPWRWLHLTQDVRGEPFSECAHRSYLSADLRSLSLFDDAVFDATLCISTLEHVGMDNRHYGGTEEASPESMWQAVRELLRVTKRILVITVPYGEGGNEKFRPWQASDLRALYSVCEDLSGHVAVEPRYYATASEGWYGGGPFQVTPMRDGKVTQMLALRITRWG